LLIVGLSAEREPAVAFLISVVGDAVSRFRHIC